MPNKKQSSLKEIKEPLIKNINNFNLTHLGNTIIVLINYIEQLEKDYISHSHPHSHNYNVNGD